MKVAESIAGAKEFHIAQSVANAMENIRKLIETYGPRAPGSEAELNAQQAMAEQLKTRADSVGIEPFIVHRQAFMGFIPFTVACGVAAAILFFFKITLLTQIAAIVGVLGGLPLILEFVLYWRFIDPLFKKQTSHNVIARYNSTGTTKKRIILVGHADSQYEWTLNYKLGGNGMKGVLIPAVVGFVVIVVAALLKTLTEALGADWAWLNVLYEIVRWGIFAFFPFFAGFLFFQSHSKSVPGAADNLSGCQIAMSVLEELADAGIRFEDTEVDVVLSGSEEAGLRGAKAYVERHTAELHDPSVDTIVIALDTFRDLKDMAVYDRDRSGTVRHDKRVKELVKTAAAHCGLDLPYASIYIGASDAAAFTKAGIPATGFAAMDPTPPRYYHTRLDNWDILEPDAIEKGLEVTLEAVCMFGGQQATPSGQVLPAEDVRAYDALQDVL
ncbi:MAG: M20/M25/M40 family metallo-hydrolase [Oscillospiraceae bacterium]|jgi:acetylornithine deacetylase/succinyl-diaminopimelate desuccinylase-like protein|nr:M20/M25/M40 family metallo-hydrolase [Oscillospiraceae bacterium]